MKRIDHLKGIRINFDKESLRENVYNFSYREARRLNSCIYDALLKELYEDYYVVTADYFQRLVEMENKLLNDRTIRDRVSDEPKLLFGLYDKCRTAEKVLLTNRNDGTKIFSRLLLQCLYLCDSYRDKYDWLFQALHDILPKLCERVCKRNDQYMQDESYCMILHKSANLIVTYNKTKAIELLHKAFDIALGSNWTIFVEDKVGSTHLSSMTESLAQTLSKILLGNAYDVVRTDAVQSIKNAEDALKILAKAHYGSTNKAFLLAYLDLAYFYIESGKLEEANKILDYIKEKLDSLTMDKENYITMMSKYFYFAGICCERMNNKELALRNHLDCVAITRDTDLKIYAARSLLELAKIYNSLGYVQSRMAEESLKQARVIFIQENNTFELRMCKYIQAKMKASHVYPMLYDLIKRSTVSICDHYRLFEWKTRRIPFWRNIYKIREIEKHNPLRCYLVKRGEDPFLQPKILNNFRVKSAY